MTMLRHGQSRSRPIRVAFLVADGEHAQLALDGIFAESYRRWGGRFSLIVPCDDNRIPRAYWPWLEVYDPDIVYSYVPLVESDILEVHERLNPSIYKLHEFHGAPRLDVHGFKPEYGLAPLSSLSTIFRSARYRRPGDTGGALEILDCWLTDSVSRSFTDNFGTYHTSYGTSQFPHDAGPAARLLTIVSPEKQSGRFGVPRDLNAIPSEQVAFEDFAHRRATSLSMASLLFAPKLEMRLHNWGSSFQLIVGDEFADRVMFWNGRLLFPNWLNGDLCGLRISLDQLDDEVFIPSLVELLNQRNYVNGGNGGQNALTIRSTSVAADRLTSLAERLSLRGCWSNIQTEFVTSLDEMLPTSQDLRHASPGHRLGEDFTFRPDWTEFSWELPTARPPSSAPDHLSDAPPRQHFATGLWATDFILEHEAPTPHFSNTNLWTLPRRWSMAGAFRTTFARGGAHDRHWPARTSSNGHLTLFERADAPVQTITVPTSYEAINYALTQSGYSMKVAGTSAVALPGRVVLMEPSNEARYLNGVLGLCGGLKEARSYLLHPFMIEIFSKLGGTPSLPHKKVEPIVNSLKKASSNIRAFDLANPHERLALGTLIVKAAQTLKTPLAFLKLSEIVTAWDAHREAFRKKEQSKPQEDPSGYWDARERESLKSCLIEMRNRQVLFQGHRWTCRECHHRNWVDLSSLNSVLTCTICHTEVDAPIDFEWLFRPNEFLIEGLRDHSVLSILWVLGTFCDRARSSLIYGASSKLWFDKDEDGPDAEVDILMSCDGLTYVAEVKSSWASLRTSDIDDLAALALRLRANVALLAVMDTGENLKGKIDEARAELSAAGIRLELLTLDHAPLTDSPYLS